MNAVGRERDVLDARHRLEHGDQPFEVRPDGRLSAGDAQAAQAERIRINPTPAVSSARHGYAKEYLRQQFREDVR